MSEMSEQTISAEARRVHEPLRKHECRIGWRAVPLPEGHGARTAGYTTHLVMDGQWDPPGTVRECDDCGKTWVGYREKFTPGMRGHILLTTQWRAEGRFERWRRERRAVRQARKVSADAQG